MDPFPTAAPPQGGAPSRPSTARLDAWLHKTGIAQQLAEGLHGSQLQLDDPTQEPLSIQVDALSAVADDLELGSMLINTTGWR
jgi:hypothetical protein